MKKYIFAIMICVLISSLAISVFAGSIANDSNNNEMSKAEIEKSRIRLLEHALEPKDPHAAAKTWAEAITTRNGALQYVIMTPNLKNEYYSRFVGLNWVTGVSSPWIESYEISEKYRIDNDIYRFEIVFKYTDSTKTYFSAKEYITVNNINGRWLISAIEKVNIKGKITKLTIGEDQKVKYLFVEDTSDEAGNYDKANVIIGSKTKIYEGYSDNELSAGDLKEGVNVLVTFTDDPRIMIYPVTAEARTIRIVEDNDLPENIDPALSLYSEKYGFVFLLPGSWGNYDVVTEEWEGVPTGDNAVESGPVIKIRHPLWTVRNPRQDIPIMILTIDQWNSLENGKFHIGAAPIGPKELSRNSKYVFALPARYNYSFLSGFEEVERILDNNPLKPLENTGSKGAESNTQIVNVYFACSKEATGGLYPVERMVPAGVNAMQAALEEMLKGPSEDEKKLGYISHFSVQTAGMLNNVKLSEDGKTATIDFADFRDLIDRNIIPSTVSFGSGGIMADITWTMFKQFPNVDALRFSFEGDEGLFWLWLSGEQHTPEAFTRKDWEQI